MAPVVPHLAPKGGLTDNTQHTAETDRSEFFCGLKRKRFET